MTAPQGTATFPGIPPEAVVSAEYTLQHGITPGICTMQIAPVGRKLRTLPGRLQFKFGNLKLNFQGCKIQSTQWLASERERRVQVTIVDRRWRWQFGAISGHYNQRRDNGTLLNDVLLENTEKTPQQLATLCLKAMGEQVFSVAALPNVLRPEVEWDYSNPAAALQDLCDMLGCRIVLGLDNRVRIARAGVGAKMPVGGEMDIADVIDPPNKPSWLNVVSAPIRFQADFTLEAVGLDWDDKIRPIDALAYKPTIGWGFEELNTFFGAFSMRPRSTDGFPVDRFAAHAKESLYRWYRIQRLVTADPSQGIGVSGMAVFPELGWVPGYGPVLVLEQILPVEDEQCEVSLVAKLLGKNSPGTYKNKPAEVWGCYTPGNDTLMSSLGTLPGEGFKVPLNPIDLGVGAIHGAQQQAVVQVSKYHKGFSIDREHGIVKFSEPVYIWTNTPVGVMRAPADLRLRCAFSIKGADHQYLRHDALRLMPNTDVLGPTRHEIHNDIQPTIYPKTGGKIDFISNKEDVDKQSKFYLDALQQEYQTIEPETATYAGLIRPPIDGAIQSITWRVGPSGATTSVSRNDERTNGRVPLYKSRRAKEKAAANLLDRAANFAARGLKNLVKGKR